MMQIKAIEASPQERASSFFPMPTDIDRAKKVQGFHASLLEVNTASKQYRKKSDQAKLMHVTKAVIKLHKNMLELRPTIDADTSRNLFTRCPKLLQEWLDLMDRNESLSHHHRGNIDLDIAINLLPLHFASFSLSPNPHNRMKIQRELFFLLKRAQEKPNPSLLFVLHRIFSSGLYGAEINHDLAFKLVLESASLGCISAQRVVLEYIMNGTLVAGNESCPYSMLAKGIALQGVDDEQAESYFCKSLEHGVSLAKSYLAELYYHRAREYQGVDDRVDAWKDLAFSYLECLSEQCGLAARRLQDILLAELAANPSTHIETRVRACLIDQASQGAPEAIKVLYRYLTMLEEKSTAASLIHFGVSLGDVFSTNELAVMRLEHNPHAYSHLRTYDEIERTINYLKNCQMPESELASLENMKQKIGSTRSVARVRV